LEHLLLISDEADASLGSIALENGDIGGTNGGKSKIGRSGAADDGSAKINKGKTGSNSGGGSGNKDGGAGGGGDDSSTTWDPVHRQIWALKYIEADQQLNGLRSKPWFFMADDDTWVNVPALLDLISRYHHRCPVCFFSLSSFHS
jgi:hypothetical protein